MLALAVAIMAAWEGWAARRAAGAALRARWRANFSMWIVDAAVTRLFSPLVAVSLAVVVAEHGGGLFPALALPPWMAFVLSLLVFDVVRYMEHRLCHHVPVLWRIHRLHHADREYDFTVSFRFHPLEVMSSIAVTAATIVALGPPPVAVLIHQLITTASSVFVHGNVRMPATLDRLLRRVVVTPDMHRVHHSAAIRESTSNLGNVLSWWDRLLGTYVERPAAGYEAMTIGLGGDADPRHLKLRWMLVDPFRADATAPLAAAPAKAQNRVTRDHEEARLSAIYPTETFTRAGGLMAYDPDEFNWSRRADKVID